MKYKCGLAIGGLTFIPNLFRVRLSVLQMKCLHKVTDMIRSVCVYVVPIMQRIHVNELKTMSKVVCMV